MPGITVARRVAPSSADPSESRHHAIGLIVLIVALGGCSADIRADRPVSLGIQESGQHRFDVVQLTDALEHPWGMAFLPDGNLLVTERPGRLNRIRIDPPDLQHIAGLPEITAKGQGGLMDVVLHPGFAANRWVYLSYAASDPGGTGTEIGRGRLGDGRLTDFEVLFRARPKAGGGRHFGSRLLFAPDGTLYISLGDRGDRPQAQALGNHLGAMIRLRDDGSVPPDNPFVSRPGAAAEIFSYGHRNVQGLARQPSTGVIWAHEHGPQGGDELNILAPGKNYGWPVITYGVNYVTGTRIGEGTHKAGMEQPVKYWVPSIAPSGLAFYDGDRFPRWRGNLFIGSLKFSYLLRLAMDEARIADEEILLKDLIGRVRDVEAGPDGFLYVLTDESPGRLVRLEPAE